MDFDDYKILRIWDSSKFWSTKNFEVLEFCNPSKFLPQWPILNSLKFHAQTISLMIFIMVRNLKSWEKKFKQQKSRFFGKSCDLVQTYSKLQKNHLGYEIRHCRHLQVSLRPVEHFYEIFEFFMPFCVKNGIHEKIPKIIKKWIFLQKWIFSKLV